MLRSTIVSFITFIILCPFVQAEPSCERVRYSINANDWKFKRAEVSKGHEIGLDDNDWLKVTIPHDYNGGSDGVHKDVFKGRFDFENDADRRLMYKGPGWYRTRFDIDKKYEGKRVFIEFEAVSLEATVWVNGQKVGRHQGGYTAFSFDITEVLRFGQENLLAVRADNTNNPAIAPWMADEKLPFPFSFDYAVYGGIYRDVWITIANPVKIEKVLNTAMCGQASPTVLSIATHVKNYSENEQTVTLTSTVVDPDGNEVAQATGQKNISPGQEVVFKQMKSALGQIQFWDVDHPKIYTVRSILSCDGKQVDQFQSIFGIRYFTLANGQAFSLNGEKMLIRGVNRHQDMEGVGYALSNAQHHADANMIKEAGFNFVRHAHYPCDPEFARACDELGVMLWLEIPLTGSTSDDPAFFENCQSQLQEMIEQYYNNPSVVLWGIGNESDRSGAPEAVSNHVFRELVKTAKMLDQNRTTTGCNYQYQSNQDLVDVYAPQDWSGWYGGVISDYRPEKLIGEYGCSIHYPMHNDQTFDAGQSYHPDGRPDFWSQEYGAFLHEYKVSTGQSRMDNFPGHCVWVAFDFASPRVGRGSNPIPYMNQKGLVLHDHKTKKDVYYFYQSMYRDAADYPMVYIVSESWTDRWAEPGEKDVWVYSNCDTVELFNDNGTRSFGKRTKNAGPRGDTRIQWDAVDVQYNVLHAVGYHKGKQVATHTIKLKNLQSPNQ
ncbi:MAG: glycoside hydrolase family 2 protein [Planctomycetota bacterium]